MARARDRRRGAERSGGGAAVRRAASGHLLPRRPHARPFRRRRREPYRPTRAYRVRHRVRSLRSAGLRAGRARLSAEAGRTAAARRHRQPSQGTPAVVEAGDQHRAAAAATERAAREAAERRRQERAAAMDPRAIGKNPAPHRDRRCRLPSLRRQVHARRVAGWRQTGRGGGADAAEGAARAARREAIRPGPSLGGRESARDQPCQAATTKPRRST